MLYFKLFPQQEEAPYNNQTISNNMDALGITGARNRKNESLRLLTKLFEKENIKVFKSEAEELFKDPLSKEIMTSHTITEWSDENPVDARALRPILRGKNNFEKYLILREKKIIGALEGKKFADFEKKILEYDQAPIRKQLFGENLDDSHNWEKVLTERAAV